MCYCTKLTGEGSQAHRKDTGGQQQGAAEAERFWEEKGVGISGVGCRTRSWRRGVKPFPPDTSQLLVRLCEHLYCKTGFGGQKQPGEVRDHVTLSFLAHSSEGCPHCVILGRGRVAGLLFCPLVRKPATPECGLPEGATLHV